MIIHVLRSRQQPATVDRKLQTGIDEGKNMDRIILLIATLLLLFVVGTFIGFMDRERFSPRWLIIAAALVALNDAAITSFYGWLPNLLPGAELNWQGKILALAATLCVAALPAFGWQASGLTLTQAPGSLKSAIPATLVYCAFFVAVALMFSDGPATGEDVAFQLTIPGFEEEPFWRGILLLSLDRVYAGRVRFLGVDWGWGALLACTLFGMGHAFDFSDGQFSFDAITMAATGVPSLLGVWMRQKTGSILFPILLHNFGNSFSLLV